MEKVLDLNTNLILLGKWPRSSPVPSESIIGLFIVDCLSNWGLATFHREVSNRQYRVFFECNSTRIKRVS